MHEEKTPVWLTRLLPIAPHAQCEVNVSVFVLAVFTPPSTNQELHRRLMIFLYYGSLSGAGTSISAPVFTYRYLGRLSYKQCLDQNLNKWNMSIRRQHLIVLGPNTEMVGCHVHNEGRATGPARRWSHVPDVISTLGSPVSETTGSCTTGQPFLYTGPGLWSKQG